MPERHLTVGQCRPCFRSSRPAVQPLRQELCPGWLARLHYLPGQGDGPAIVTRPAKGSPRRRYLPGQGHPPSLPAWPRGVASASLPARPRGRPGVPAPARDAGLLRRTGEIPGGVFGHGPVLLRDQFICWQLSWPRPGPLSRASAERCCTVTVTVRKPDVGSACSVASADRKMACRGSSPGP